jgi:hypothetical protein
MYLNPQKILSVSIIPILRLSTFNNKFLTKMRSLFVVYMYQYAGHNVLRCVDAKIANAKDLAAATLLVLSVVGEHRLVWGAAAPLFSTLVCSSTV